MTKTKTTDKHSKSTTAPNGSGDVTNADVSLEVQGTSTTAPPRRIGKKSTAKSAVDEENDGRQQSWASRTTRIRR